MPLDADTRRMIVAEYDGGASQDEVAALFGVARATVNKYIRRAGVVRPAARMSEAEAAEAEQLYRAGLKMLDIEARTGWSADTIQRAMARRGVPMRRVGYQRRSA